jgi:hypothetical protein
MVGQKPESLIIAVTGEVFILKLLKMKKILLNYIVPALVLLCFSCKKENVATPLALQKIKVPTPEYLANLLAYKSSAHEVCYGYFTGYANGNWSDMRYRLEALPDSMDIVTFFENFMNVPPPSNPASATMVNIRQTKGTKFIVGMFPGDADAFYTPPPNVTVDSAAKVVAKMLNDTLTKYKLDGVDFDIEPGGGNYWLGNYASLLLAMSKYLGPKSGTGKLLIMDVPYGDGNEDADVVQCLSYYVGQDYSYGSSQELAISPNCPSNKYIACDWMVNTSTDFNGIPGYLGYLGYAAWNPANGAKGGAGLYGPMDNYNAANPYSQLRQMIQIMNPAVR